MHPEGRYELAILAGAAGLAALASSAIALTLGNTKTFAGFSALIGVGLIIASHAIRPPIENSDTSVPENTVVVPNN